jgi:GNAT superfamily N-acetyltransferase
MRSGRESAPRFSDSGTECESSSLRFEPFKADTVNVKSFDCGNDELNEFLRTDEVKEFEREHLGKTTLVYCSGELAAYYMIYAGSLERAYIQKHGSLSKATTMHVKSIPAIIVGRLAVDRKWQRKGVGKAILERIMMYAVDSSCHLGIRLILVQAKLDAIPFYEKVGFVAVPAELKEEAKRIRMKGTRTLFLDIDKVREALGE